MAQQLIDLDHLNRYVAGDRSLRDEILAIFEEQAEMWTRMLDPQAEDTAWRDAAHALKGASRGVGAWEVGHICQAAEHLIGEQRDDAERIRMLKSLQGKVRETIAEVRRLRDL
ncbi:Hpt domain-containing protein [Parvularcula dongshanensis]|uniref:HPt (Histidine-containing phosphotransfer) domain-containing protein n=1 Tax=Parvularcula dongshanensis TaxID=1173995 RepID=A0A840I795_9PROT|nr:HPt (histidine-containing phosphotransfer) domain-containing protein [Parvularcula dongshanensis]